MSRFEPVSKVTAPISVVAAVVVLVVASIIYSSVYTVEQGERAVILRFGEVQGISEPGLHFKIPAVDTTRSITVRTVKFSDTIAAYSKDVQSLDVGLSVNYKLNPANVAEIYSKFGMSYESAVIVPRILAAPKDVIGRYAAVDIVQNRNELSQLILKDMDNFFMPMGIMVESINIENIDFSDAYEKSVEARMQAEVEVQKVRQNLEREKLNADMVRVTAQGEADAKVARAKADAEAIVLQGEAEARAIRAKTAALAQNPGYVKLIEAERWDGKLPQTMIPNQSIPVLSK